MKPSSIRHLHSVPMMKITLENFELVLNKFVTKTKNTFALSNFRTQKTFTSFSNYTEIESVVV